MASDGLLASEAGHRPWVPPYTLHVRRGRVALLNGKALAALVPLVLAMCRSQLGGQQLSHAVGSLMKGACQSSGMARVWRQEASAAWCGRPGSTRGKNSWWVIKAIKVINASATVRAVRKIEGQPQARNLHRQEAAPVPLEAGWASASGRHTRLVLLPALLRRLLPVLVPLRAQPVAAVDCRVVGGASGEASWGGARCSLVSPRLPAAGGAECDIEPSLLTGGVTGMTRRCRAVPPSRAPPHPGSP